MYRAEVTYRLSKSRSAPELQTQFTDFLEADARHKAWLFVQAVQAVGWRIDCRFLDDMHLQEVGVTNV